MVDAGRQLGGETRENGNCGVEYAVDARGESDVESGGCRREEWGGGAGGSEHGDEDKDVEEMRRRNVGKRERGSEEQKVPGRF